MIIDQKTIAIIPARGGSKTLPRKNILDLNGKPLIAWSIETGLENNFIDKLMVSTDDPEIAEIAKVYGADVPFLRPASLSSDTSKSIDVLFHALDHYQQKNEHFDIVLLLQPTSPLRISNDITKAFELLHSQNAKAVVSVSEVKHHPFLCNTLPENLNMQFFLTKEQVNTNRQQYPKYYHINGAIYLSQVVFLRTNLSFYGQDTFAYIMPKERAVDIDDFFDFKIAEFLMTTQIANP
jgi:CMP-N,N'-diacetyllegionaminic acid synthase